MVQEMFALVVENKVGPLSLHEVHHEQTIL